MTPITLRPANADDALLLDRLSLLMGRDLRPSSLGTSLRLWLAMDGTRCLAACASHTRTVWIDGEARPTAVLDLPFEAAEDLERLRREDVTTRLAEALLEATFAGLEGDFLVGAFVHEDHAEHMQALYGLEVVRTQGRLMHTLGAVPSRSSGPQESLGERTLSSGDLGVPDVQVRWLWERCAGSLAISTIRDADLFSELLAGGTSSRVPRTPLGTRDADGVLRALAVIAEGADDHGALLVWEWLVAEEEPDAAENLLFACQERAARAGAKRIDWMLPSWSPWSAWLQERGAIAGPSHHLLLGRTDLSRYDAFWLRDNWWAQPLDWAANAWESASAMHEAPISK